MIWGIKNFKYKYTIMKEMKVPMPLKPLRNVSKILILCDDFVANVTKS